MRLQKICILSAWLCLILTNLQAKAYLGRKEILKDLQASIAEINDTQTDEQARKIIKARYGNATFKAMDKRCRATKNAHYMHGQTHSKKV